MPPRRPVKPLFLSHPLRVRFANTTEPSKSEIMWMLCTLNDLQFFTQQPDPQAFNLAMLAIGKVSSSWEWNKSDFLWKKYTKSSYKVNSEAFYSANHAIARRIKRVAWNRVLCFQAVTATLPRRIVNWPIKLSKKKPLEQFLIAYHFNCGP